MTWQDNFQRRTRTASRSTGRRIRHDNTRTTGSSGDGRSVLVAAAVCSSWLYQFALLVIIILACGSNNATITGVLAVHHQGRERVICSLTGGLDITRLASATIRNFFRTALEDVELIREYISEAAINDGLQGGFSNLTAMSRSLDRTARNLTANESNVTTTLQAGLGYTEDRADRRVVCFVSLANAPLAGAKQTDMMLVDSASNIFPWIVDRRAVESNWFVSHQNGRRVQDSQSEIPKLYTAAWIGTYGEAWLYYPPLTAYGPAHSFGDVLGHHYDSHSEEFVEPNLPRNNPQRKAYFTKPYPDTAVPGLSLITAQAPVYYNGTFRGVQYNDTYVASTGVDISVSSLSTILLGLEGTLSPGSFACLLSALDFHIVVVSQSTVHNFCPSLTGNEDSRVTYDAVYKINPSFAGMAVLLSTWYFLPVVMVGSISVLFLLLLLAFAVPFALATVAAVLLLHQNPFPALRQHDNNSNENTNNELHRQQCLFKSGLYVGRVWHTRFHPVRHVFQYPLFIFCLDLDEVAEAPPQFEDSDDEDDQEAEDKKSPTRPLPVLFPWPFSIVCKFRSCDHLKNREGFILPVDNGNFASSSTKGQQQRQEHSKVKTKKRTKTARATRNDVIDRVLRLAADRTGRSGQMDRSTYSVQLVTHLCYYGYCFNPVSFYYVCHRQPAPPTTMTATTMTQHQQEQHQLLDCIVAEVSNTPWNEMHCYVLHRDSVDNVKVMAARTKAAATTTTVDADEHHAATTMTTTATMTSMNYVFPKMFHVSPFMEMQYDYDWTFQPTGRIGDEIHIINTLVRQQQQQKQKEGSNNDRVKRQLQFHARMHVHKSQPSSLPASLLFRKDQQHHHVLFLYRVAWYMAVFPTYCTILQIWIHYQAFCLFVQGVPFQPHPHGAETFVSKIIGSVMVPFFAAQEWWLQRRRHQVNCTASASDSKRD
jgi:uncharacterized protein